MGFFFFYFLRYFNFSIGKGGYRVYIYLEF